MHIFILCTGLYIRRETSMCCTHGVFRNRVAWFSSLPTLQILRATKQYSHHSVLVESGLEVIIVLSQNSTCVYECSLREELTNTAYERWMFEVKKELHTHCIGHFAVSTVLLHSGSIATRCVLHLSSFLCGEFLSSLFYCQRRWTPSWMTEMHLTASQRLWNTTSTHHVRTYVPTFAMLLRGPILLLFYQLLARVTAFHSCSITYDLCHLVYR